MSFILDALRKSEHERQRRAGPAIADLVVVPRRSSTPLILLIVGVLLLANLAAVAYFLMRDEAPAPGAAIAPADSLAAAPAVAAATGNAVATPQAEHPAPGVEPPRPVRPLVAEAAPVAAPPAPDATPPAAPDPLLLPPASRAAQQPPASTQGPRPAANADFVPRLDTLPPQATAGLPVLNLDLHIYAGDPAQRAVFINGRRYREGDSLPEGIEVAAITPEGAVLRYQGQRFLLPRQ